MNPRLSTKILRPDFQGEFTASILAAAASPDLISFAGGLPNPVSFPVEAMDKATHKVLEKNGVMALQYSGTQGYLPLREWVAKRYETMGVYGVTADDIIITNGSQQVLTMIGACMLDPGDKIIVENPTYLVALQSFHFFDPEVLPVTINLANRMIQTTTLVVLIGVVEVLKTGQQIIDANRFAHPTAALWVYAVIFLMYFAICYLISLLSKRLERKWQS